MSVRLDRLVESPATADEQTLVSGYLPADPPDGMLPRAAARWRAQPALSRYRSFVLVGHVALDDAIAAGRDKRLERIKVEHQIARDSRSVPVVVDRWLIDGLGVVIHQPAPGVRLVEA